MKNQNIDTDSILKQKLSSALAVKTYFELMDGIAQRKILTREFQHDFNRFCMIRRGDEWQRVYYGLFAELADCRDSCTLENVLPELDGRLMRELHKERFEFSYSSKMLAFLRPNDFPIWDKWVVKNMLEKFDVDLRVKVLHGIAQREQEALLQYEKLTVWFRKAVASKSVQKSLKRFDDYLPTGVGERISKIKKLDWLLWAEREVIDGDDWDFGTKNPQRGV